MVGRAPVRHCRPVSPPTSPETTNRPTILFATAELAPLARVGGLAEAAAGLVAGLRRAGTTVIPVIPDYGGITLTNETRIDLDVASWAGPAVARRGEAAEVGQVVLVDLPGLARPHPYVDPATGDAWLDNDHRFVAFSAAVAAVSNELEPDVLHLNDWHTSATLGFLADPPPTVLTIHTLGVQGLCDAGRLQHLPYGPRRFAWYDVMNPLVGAIRSADVIRRRQSELRR